MTLATQYSIAVRHQRSTRIDSDLSPDFFPGLVYHGTAQTALETLARQYAQSEQKMFTLTGPYGSGKSTIALLLLGLLNNNEYLREAADSVINDSSRELLKESITCDKGWLQIRSVGGVTGPVETFWTATLSALREHPNTSSEFDEYQGISPKNEAELLQVWEELFLKINDKVDGVLLIADEMGKTLEFINKNKQELHLFQDLGEVLSRIKTPVLFLGLLHQSFAEYAKERGTKLQEEWSKIQGRYNDIPYSVTADETVSLIGNSIINAKPDEDVRDDSLELSLYALTQKEVSEQADLKNQERKKLLAQRLSKCLPLHPLTAMLLGPISKRPFSQNERSTFSFLNSHEPKSFQMFLKEHSLSTDRYKLHHLWDYLEANLEHVILTTSDGHAWSEASEAIRKAISNSRDGLEQKTLELLKSIAILNLFGRSSDIVATNPALQAAVEIEREEELQDRLATLQNLSCIVYRKYQSEWVIFEGSDLNIQSLLDEKIEQLANSTDAINQIPFSQQVIAKGHYHTVGTLRWAEHSITQDLEALDLNAIEASRKGEFANFILSMSNDDPAFKKALTEKHQSIAVATAINAEEISLYAKEIYALELLKTDEKVGGTFRHDRVAKKEFESLLSNAQKLLKDSVDDAFNKSTWYVHGEAKENFTFSQIASELADELFHLSPKVPNELVNRNKLSGTAVSALKKLLERMLDHEDEEDLGITGFPPEKSMYISCLKKTYIHSASGENGCHWFNDNLGRELDAVFAAALKTLKDNQGTEVKLSQIAELWSKPPFGLTQGVIPIFLLAFMKSLGQDIAYYERATSGDYEFIAEPDVDYIHKLIKSSDELAIKHIVLAQEERDWLQQLGTFAATETNRDVANNILSVATPLVTTIHNLPQWVKNAHSFVEQDTNKNKLVLSVRDLFLRANDPHALLIKDLVKILDPDQKLTFNERIDILADCFKVLREKHELMLAGIKSKVKSIFPETGEELAAMCHTVEQNSGDIRLKAFARELAKSDTGLMQWLESMIQVVIGRGKQNWNEGVLLTASNKISDYAQDFLSVVKSQPSNSGESQVGPKTKLVSLVLEDDEGKLQSYKKEIRLADEQKIAPTRDAIKANLNGLDEFEKINLLQQMLKETLEAQV